MNLLKFEKKMQERGASLNGSNLTHDKDSYKVIGVDLANHKKNMTIRYQDQDIVITMNNWNIIAVRYDMVRGFAWVMK
jgi:hypothetical protein